MDGTKLRAHRSVSFRFATASAHPYPIVVRGSQLVLVSETRHVDGPGTRKAVVELCGSVQSPKGRLCSLFGILKGSAVFDDGLLSRIDQTGETRFDDGQNLVLTVSSVVRAFDWESSVLESEGPSEGVRVMLLIPPASDTGVLCREWAFLRDSRQAKHCVRRGSDSEPVTNHFPDSSLQVTYLVTEEGTNGTVGRFWKSRVAKGTNATRL
jgi:hypothetical protein